MVSLPRSKDSLHADSFLFALGTRLNQAPEEAREDAYTGAAAWSGFVFTSLSEAAEDCGMVSCDAHPATRRSGRPTWARREHLFDVTWYHRDCSDWETPLLILEHENAWDRGAFLVDFWKLLMGYAPLRVMMGYARHADAHDDWIRGVNEILSKDVRQVRIPDGVDDVILLGHRRMQPSEYAVYRREGRAFVRTEDSLSSVSMPNPDDATAWDVYIQRISRAAEERVRAEVARLQRAKIIDGAGRVIRQGTPPDMAPTSETSTLTG